MNDYVCSRCGAKAFYDGRCGDGPVLTCGCDKRGSVYVNEGSRGGYWTNPTQSQPVSQEEYSDGRDPDDYWKYGTNPTQSQPVEQEEYSDGRDPDDYWKYGKYGR